MKFSVQNIVAHGACHAAFLDDEPGDHDIVHDIDTHFTDFLRNERLHELAVADEYPPSAGLTEALSTQIAAVFLPAELHAHFRQPFNHVRHGFSPLPHGFRKQTVGRTAVELHHVVNGVERCVRVQNTHEVIVAAADAAAAFQFSLVNQQRPFAGFPRRNGRTAAARASTKNQYIGLVEMNGSF